VQEQGDVCGLIEQTFDHCQTERVPLWGIVHNRGVYEHVLGADVVGDAADVSLEEKLRLHSRVYRQLGIDITRAQLWPPDRRDTRPAQTVWAEREVIAAKVNDYEPQFPDDAGRDEVCRIGRLQIAANAPHTVFAPTIRGTFCATFEAMGLEEFSYACADAPGHIERIMLAHMEYARSLADRYAACPEVRFLAICDDCAYKGGTIASPQWMRKNWLDQIAYIVEPFKRRRIRVIFHSDGKLDALIPDLVGIGVDAINPLEPLAGMDLAKLKSGFGKDVTLIGSVDCSQLLPFGSPQQIRDEVRRLLDIGAPGGGFIIGDSSSILPGTPVENVLAFYETVHQYRG
jgi:hypothetical protein